MFCTKCGEQIKDGGKFCPKCGAPLKGTPSGKRPASAPLKIRQTSSNTPPETKRQESVETPEQKKGIGSTPVIVGLVLLILLLLAGIGGGAYYFLTHNSAQTARGDDEDDAEGEEDQETEDEAEEETEGQSMSDEEENPQVNIVFTDEDADAQDAWMDADYILDFSAWREVTEADLEGLNPDQLRIARNEIYARHGRQFLDEELNQWFYDKEWYQDIPEKYSPEEFDSLSPSPLSDLERKNAAFISEYEKKLEETAD